MSTIAPTALPPITEYDIEILHADLNDAIQCGALIPHPVPAEWWMECACGVTTYLCDGHRRMFDAQVRELMQRGGWVSCVRCDRRPPMPAQWVHL